MAKYEDYAENVSIEDEIDEAGQATQEREPELPAQFQGKSQAEIAQSYQELQRTMDRQGNELGELRNTNQHLTNELQRNSPKEAPPEPITVDDLYLDPEEVINRKVDQRVSGKLEELERTLNNIQASNALDKLEVAYPGFRNEAKSEEMQSWIQESGYRGRLAVAADQGDLQAAEDLIGMYYDLKGKSSNDGPDPSQRQNLQNATLESGTTTVRSPVEKFSRSKLELARRMAKRGDLEAETYLKANSDSIFRAYEEGRIVN